MVQRHVVMSCHGEQEANGLSQACWLATVLASSGMVVAAALHSGCGPHSGHRGRRDRETSASFVAVVSTVLLSDVLYCRPTRDPPGITSSINVGGGFAERREWRSSTG